MPAFLVFGFPALALMNALLLSYTMSLASQHRRRTFAIWLLGALVWAGLHVLVAHLGGYLATDWPAYVFIALPVDAFAIVYTLKIKRDRLAEIPLSYLLLINSLRLPLWLLMGMSSGVGLIPDWEWFPVYQFDWIVGLTALATYLWIGESSTPTRWQKRSIGAITLFGLLSFASAIALLASTLSKGIGPVDQPATLLLTYPGVLLPAVIGPILLMSHFLMLRKLIRSRRTAPFGHQ